MPDYHVHVYIISGMVEVDVFDAKGEEDARSKALQACKGRLVKFPDCSRVAITQPLNLQDGNSAPVRVYTDKKRKCTMKKEWPGNDLQGANV